MSKHRPHVRAMWLVYALLQLVLPGAASIVDARLEAASLRARPTAHIEEHSGPTCPRIHPADCAFCRVLSASASPAVACAVPPVARRHIAAPLAEIVQVVRFVRHAARARAPPGVA